MTTKRIIYTILLISWMIVIFLFSSQNGLTSQSTSDHVASVIIDTTVKITNQEITEEKRTNLIEDTRVMVRKSAHFTLYFILGILSFLTLNSYQVSKPFIYGVLLCFLYACSDEFHQMFSDGRTAKFLDIMIDTLGATISSSLTCLFQKK